MSTARLKSRIALVSAAGDLLRDAALTIGPALLRLQSLGKEGAAFQGLVEAPRTEPGNAVDELKASTASRPAYPVDYFCGNCGGRDVSVEAYASWNPKAQAWVCDSVYERQAQCGRCGDTFARSERLHT